MNITAGELLSHDPRTTIINAGRGAGKREIRGAIRYNPHELLSAEHLALPIAHNNRIILYAEHGNDENLVRSAEKMRAEGYSDVRVYEGTLAAYEQAGGETQAASMQQIIPPSHPAGAA
jgi:rhodanese-related sulfurtransferase